MIPTPYAIELFTPHGWRPVLGQPYATRELALAALPGYQAEAPEREFRVYAAEATK